MFLKFLQILQENICVGFSILRTATLFKKTPTEAFSCEICAIFKNTFFEKNLRMTASTAIKTHCLALLINWSNHRWLPIILAISLHLQISQCIFQLYFLVPKEPMRFMTRKFSMKALKVMQIERALINDRLHFQMYPENFAFQLFLILQ